MTEVEGNMDIVSVGDAARICGVSEPTIRYWEKVGKLRGFRTPSRQRLFLRSVVEQLARERGAK